MPGKKTSIAAVLLLLILALGASAGVRAEQGVSVNGFVYDRTGLPVANATVTLLVDNTPLTTASNPATTDLNGYYNFFGIQRGTYCLVAEKYPFSASATILVQSVDKTTNFALQGSTADLADASVTIATPTMIAGPENATAMPPANASAGPTAAPGFDVAMALFGVYFLGLAKRLKR